MSNTAKRARLLLVDDDFVNLQVLKSSLGDLYDIDTAMDGRSALKQVLKETYDLILLDVVMPGIDGHKVCQILQQDANTSSIPVLFLSAETQSEAIIRGFRLGAVDYVTKPIIADVLRARVDTQLRVKSLFDELKEKNKKLEELVIKDGLTGLYNHTHIHTLLHQHIALGRRHDFPLSVLMFDLDLFKEKNDSFGHQAGDEVLKAVAEVFIESARETDSIGRYGGEEFLMILPHTPIEGAQILAGRILKRVAVLKFSEKKLKVTVSCGVSTMEEGDTVVSLVNRADENLYKAKDGGRNQVV